jgi:multidrug efflux system membrane fusion protein
VTTKRSYVVAVFLALGAAGWIASGQFTDGGGVPEPRKPPADLSAADQAPMVRVRRQTAEPRVREAILRGRTEALHTVEVKAETHGRIIELLIARGTRVERNQTIARLATEDRPAKLQEAEALFAQRRIEYEAAERLSKKGFRAETQLAGAKAAMKAAAAAVQRARVELDNTEIRAPFDGLVDDRMTDMGHYVEKGDAIARVTALDPILVVAQVSERDVGRLEAGIEGRAHLITGQTVTGRLRFVGAMADSATRTFRVELEVANPEDRIPDGITAELRIALEQNMAHLVSPAILTLTDQGVLGVKTLEADGTVGFYPVRILESATDGVWIGDLPEEVTFITVGQEFVGVGQPVRAVDEQSLDRTLDTGGKS